MRPLPALLVLLLAAAMVPAPPADAQDLPPSLGQPSYQVTYSDNGTQITIILETNLTFLGYLAKPPAANVVLEPKQLYLRSCYPCEPVVVPLYGPKIVDHCFVGTTERSEQRVCLWDRNEGLSLELGEVGPFGVAALVLGAGCIVHERDGLPPQKVAFEGIALPAAQLGNGGRC